MYKNREKYLASQKRYNEKNRLKRALLTSKWRRKYPEKRREWFDVYRRSLWGYPIFLFQYIKRRIKYSPSYKGRSLTFSKERFFLFLRKSNYPDLHSAWVASGYNKRLSPSVDRINNKKGYTIKNIQIITNYENTKKGNR